MLKVGIIGANGRAGALIAKNAVLRNMDVTAIVRHPNDTDKAYSVLQKDLFELTQEDVKDFDVLVCATAFFQEPAKFETSMNHLIEILQGTSIHLMVVGGAGSLYMDDTHTTRLKDTEDFDAAFKPTADAMTAGLEALKASKDIQWTYVSPAADFTTMGGLTGKYEINGSEFTTNLDGKSFLSYKDYAQAFVTIMIKKQYLNRHVSVHHV